MQNLTKQDLQKSQNTQHNRSQQSQSDHNSSSNQENTRNACPSQFNDIKLQNQCFQLSQEIKTKLQCEGIQYKVNQFYSFFIKSCIKTNWQSTTYFVKYGNFKMHLNVIHINLSPKVFNNNFINKGTFSYVTGFEVYSKNYALKNIKIQKENSDTLGLALREIMMAKILSVLQIGPKFENLFGYDAIVFENQIQFAMQMCKNFQQVDWNKQTKNKTLISSLKIMHDLHICHLDIKQNNIAWSPTFNKFVFIDFGFTSIVKQSIGFKTKTKFIGTFSYCCPQMKKLYFLKNEGFVNLYQNDIHCLQVFYKQLLYIKSQNLGQNKQDFYQQIDQQFLHSSQTTLFRRDKNIVKFNKERSNCTLVNFFLFKKAVFEQNFQVLLKLIEGGTQQRQIYCRIIYNACRNFEQNRKIKWVNFLNSMAKKQEKQPSLMNHTNSILLQYQVNRKSQLTVNGFLKIEQILNSKNILMQIFADKTCKQNIFFMLDFYSNQERQTQEIITSLISKIYQIISQNQRPQNDSKLLKFRRILCYYCQYFKNQKNISALEKILVYFLLMEDVGNYLRTQQIILQIFQKDKKYEQFIAWCLLFFMGDLIVTKNKNPQRIITKINHLQRLANLDEPQISKNILRLLEFSVGLMRNLKLIYKNSFELNKLSPDFIEKVKLFFVYYKKSNMAIYNSIEKLIQIIARKGNFKWSAILNKLQINSYHFESFYLQKCYLRLQMLNCASLKNYGLLKQLLDNEQFTKNFQTYFHFFILDNNIPAKKALKKSICLDILSIQNINLQNFQNPLNLNRLTYQFLKNQYNLQDIFQFYIKLLQQFKLQKIQNTQNLYNFQNSLFHILMCMICDQKNFSKEKYNKYAEQIWDILYPFVLFAKQIQVLIQKYKVIQNLSQIHQRSIFSSYKKTFQYPTMFLKIGLCMIAKKNLEYQQTMLQLIRQDQKIFVGKLSIMELIYLAENITVSNNLSMEIRNRIIQKSTQILYSSKINLLVKLPEILVFILKIYIKQELYQKAFEYLRQFCIYANKLDYNIHQSLFFKNIAQFFNLCFVPQLYKLLQRQSIKNICQFAKCPQMTVFIGILLFKLRKNQINLPMKMNKKLIIKCISYIHLFTQGHFRVYKQKIYKQAFKSIKSYKSRTCIKYNRKFGILKSQGKNFDEKHKNIGINLLKQRIREKIIYYKDNYRQNHNLKQK